MCRSCDQTPDGAGRRCPNRADGFTPRESDQRSRTRGLNAAQNALAENDPQGAANALARAVSAQRDIDGLDQSMRAEPMPDTPPAQPARRAQRDVFASPHDTSKVRAELDNINRARARDGKTPIVVDIVVQRKNHPTDPMLRLERVRVNLSGASQDELNSIALTSASDRTAEAIDTQSAVATAHAIARSTGGFRTKAEAGNQSTAAMLSAYLADAPGGQLRQAIQVTDKDHQDARNTIAWSQSTHPTSEYLRSVRDTLANKTVTHRSLALAVSAIPAAQRQYERDRQAAQKALDTIKRRRQAEEAAARPAPAPKQAPRQREPRKRSVWIGREGQYAHTTGIVEDIQMTTRYEGANVEYLFRIRTDGGALVKTWLSHDCGVSSGQRVTLTGTIREHEEYNGYKATIFEDCDVPIVHHDNLPLQTRRPLDPEQWVG